MTERPSKEESFFETAKIWAKQSTCTRKQVGAVLVRDGHVIATGFNGSPSGEDHCTEVGCLIIAGHCERSVHAEMNAIFQAAKYGYATNESVMYSTLEPCLRCRMAMKNSGIKEFHFLEKYGSSSNE